MADLQNIIRMVISRRLRWVRNSSVYSWKRNAYRTSVEIPERKNHSECRDVDGRILLKLILEELNGKVCIKFIGFRIGTDEFF
jgi:hypothetical protein